MDSLIYTFSGTRHYFMGQQLLGRIEDGL
jgi:hypothetical protein